jgi:hypothetical protein
MIAVFTALNVLVHSIFGCCSHLAVTHSNQPAFDRLCRTVCDNGVSAPGQHSDDCHQNYVAASKLTEAQSGRSVFPGSDSNGHRSHQCPHDSCQWLARVLGTVSIDFDLIKHISAQVVATTVLATSFATQLPPRELVGGPILAVPLRLHLVLSVLLI